MNNSAAFLSTPAASTNSTNELLSTMNNIEMTVFSINVLFGLPVHSYIVWLMVRGSEITSYFFNLNLSICEIIYSFICLLYVLSKAFPSLLVTTQCFVAVGVTGRPLFQCLICVERYLAVVHPVTFLKFKPLRYKLICSGVAWIICLVSCCFSKFFLDSLSFSNLAWIISIQFLVFLSVQLFCCLAVLRALKQSGPGERGREREEENNMKKTAFNIILITTMTMIIMFAPYIVTGIFIFFKQDVFVIWFISLSCFVLSAFVHPIIYLQRNGKLSCLCFPKKLLVGCF